VNAALLFGSHVSNGGTHNSLLKKPTDSCGPKLQNHPSAAEAALILSELAARINPCHFKTAQAREFVGKR